MNKPFIISEANLFELLKSLSGAYDVFVPVKKGQHRFYKKFPVPVGEMLIGEVRTFEPLKAFFSRAREVVAKNFKDEVPHPAKPFAIVGVKACDLKGFKIQDFVFGSTQKSSHPERSEGLSSDPIYAKNREANLVISADCTCAIETCFCLALGVQPFPQENYDLNLSSVNDGFIVTVGSAKGEAIVMQNRALFTDPSSEMLLEQGRIRRQVSQAVDKNLQDYRVPVQQVLEGVMERGYRSPIWEEEAKTCVECGACNTICPTCHCFLLYDQKQQAPVAAGNAAMERFRIWDSCLIKDFARVAGGGNPRPKLWMRLRNRFEKKFDFFSKVSGVYACTGCGRCISACPAKIDIRRVLRKLVDYVAA